MHDHRPPLHLRHQLHGGLRLQHLPELVKQSLADVRVRHLTPPKPNGELDLIARIEELRRLPGFGLKIMIPDLRLDANLLQLDDMLVLARLTLPPALFVPELPVVHHATDRRDGVGRDFDEVDPTRARQIEGFASREDTELLAVLVDDPDLADPDTLIHSWCQCWSGYCLPPGTSLSQVCRATKRRRSFDQAFTATGVVRQTIPFALLRVNSGIRLFCQV